MKHGHVCMYSIMYCVQHSPYFFEERTFSRFQRVTVAPLAAAPSCPAQARLREAAVAPTTTDVSWTDRAEIPARLATALSSLDLAAQTQAEAAPELDSSTHRPAMHSRTTLDRTTEVHLSQPHPSGFLKQEGLAGESRSMQAGFRQRMKVEVKRTLEVVSRKEGTAEVLL